MKIVSLEHLALAPITSYDSVRAASTECAAGGGEAHVHVVRLDPGGIIGPHPTGFGQLFVPISGSGWVSGADDRRHPIAVGQVAFLARGERHAKGSDAGMVALMVQIHDLGFVGPAAAV